MFGYLDIWMFGYRVLAYYNNIRIFAVSALEPLGLGVEW
jgi:hypothetical protein